MYVTTHSTTLTVLLHMVEPGENVVVLRKHYGLTHHLRPFAVSPIDDELKEVCS